MPKVLQRQILRVRCAPFIDEVPANPPSRSAYPNTNGKTKMSTIPGVQLYILEAIHCLNKVLVDIERVG